MVTSGNWPMLSAEMLSWILAALRFNSIERICDSRTPVTMTSDNSSASLAPAVDPALPVPPFPFLTSGDGVVGASCCAGSCASAPSAGAVVRSDAMAAVDAASNIMDIATDRGCLRCTFDTGFAPLTTLFIRSIDESMSHDARYSSSIGSFNGETGYDCSDR